MENLTYVTGNYGKYISAKENFEKEEIAIDYFKCDLNEPDQNDVEFISKEKARQAFALLGKPVFVIDSGFYIEAYPGCAGYPGAFVKRSGISSHVLELLETMREVDNRNCYFLDCLTFYDGSCYYQFLAVNKGTLSYELKGEKLKKAKSNLWYVFVPDHCTKTLAEMTDSERNNRPGRASATEEFLKWYQSEYKRAKQFCKK